MIQHNPVGPDDGYAYSPIELGAIWELEIDVSDLIKVYEKPFQFHRHVAVLPVTSDPTKDQWAVNLLTRAIIAEVYNDDPPEPSEWPCTTHYDDGSEKETA